MLGLGLGINKTTSIERNILQGIIDQYGATSAWSAENILVSGTTTTVYDYLGNYNLSNPTAGEQPTLGSAIGGRATLRFNNAHQIYTATPLGGSTGEIHVVQKSISNGDVIIGFSTGDEASGTRYGVSAGFASQDFGRIYYHTALNQIQTSPLLTPNDGNPHITTFGTTGSSYVVAYDAIKRTVSMASGSNDGKWLNLIGQKDSMSIGARNINTVSYAKQDWACTIITPPLSDVNRVLLHTQLASYYGISI